MDATKIKSWLRDEMKYNGVIPDDQKMRSLSGGAVQSVWENLLRYGRSQETVYSMKGNVRIARKKQAYIDNSKSISSMCLTGVRDGGERDELFSERSRLVSKLHETLAKIDRVRIGLKSAEGDRRNMHMNKEELTLSVKQKRQSTALLALYIKQIQNTVSRLTKVTEELKTLHMEIKEKVKTVKGEQVFSVGSSVESAGERNLRLGLEKTLEYMHTVLVGGHQTRSRQGLRDEILNLLSKLPSSSIARAFEKNVLSQVNMVSEIRRTFDLMEEAKNLKLEASSEGGILCSVREEVDALYEKHISTHKQLSQAKKSLLSREQEVAELLESQVENISDLSDLKVEMQRSHEAAAVQSKVQESDRLESQLCDLVAHKENQEEIINWVKGAQNNIQDMTDTISALIDSNNQGTQKLICRQAASKELIKELPATLASIQTSLGSALNQPSNNIKTFLRVPVGRYCSTMIEDKSESTLVPTPDLDIYRFRKLYPYPVSGDCEVGGGEGFLVSQSSQQNVCHKVSDLLAHIQHLDQLQQNDAETSEADIALALVNQLEDTLRNCKSQQVRDFQSLLIETDVCRRRCLELCSTVDQAFQDFNKQGVQSVVGQDSQFLVEGRSLNQWQETLRVAVANT